MTTSKRKPQPNPFEYGPYIQVAAFCERVLQEADGVVSLIRIVDVITNTQAGADPPKDMPPFHYALTLMMILKSGRAKGRHTLTVEPELPSGEKKGETSVTVQLEGEGRGVNVGMKMDFEFTMEGLYWFTVKFDEDLVLTRLPLNVRYSRLAGGSTNRPPATG